MFPLAKVYLACICHTPGFSVNIADAVVNDQIPSVPPSPLTAVAVFSVTAPSGSLRSIVMAERSLRSITVSVPSVLVFAVPLMIVPTSSLLIVISEPLALSYRQ